MTRTRYVTDAQAMDRVAADYADEGYTQVTTTADTVRLRHIDHGGLVAHALIVLVAGWWSLGLANLAYAVYRRHVSADIVEVCVREGDT